jgi:hypothetical protein
MPDPIINNKSDTPAESAATMEATPANAATTPPPGDTDEVKTLREKLAAVEAERESAKRFETEVKERSEIEKARGAIAMKRFNGNYAAAEFLPYSKDPAALEAGADRLFAFVKSLMPDFTTTRGDGGTIPASTPTKSANAPAGQLIAQGLASRRA